MNITIIFCVYGELMERYGLHDANNGNNENVVSDAASVSQINGISNQEPDTISGSFLAARRPVTGHMAPSVTQYPHC